jgi:hypothetical protein
MSGSEINVQHVILLAVDEWVCYDLTVIATWAAGRRSP